MAKGRGRSRGRGQNKGKGDKGKGKGNKGNKGNKGKGKGGKGGKKKDQAQKSAKKRDQELKRAAEHAGETSRRQRQRLSDGFIPRDEQSVYVRNLPETLQSKHELKESLRKFGEVTHVHLERHLKFGFARFGTKEGADAAIHAGKVLVLDKEIEICSAQKEQRFPEKDPLTEDENNDTEAEAEDDAASHAASDAAEDVAADRDLESGSEASMAAEESWARQDMSEPETEEAELAERNRVLGILEAIRFSTAEVLRKANSKLALSELESCSDITQLKEELPGKSALVQILRSLGSSFKVKDRGDGVFMVSLTKVDKAPLRAKVADAFLASDGRGAPTSKSRRDARKPAKGKGHKKDGKGGKKGKAKGKHGKGEGKKPKKKPIVVNSKRKREESPESEAHEVRGTEAKATATAICGSAPALKSWTDAKYSSRSERLDELRMALRKFGLGNQGHTSRHQYARDIGHEAPEFGPLWVDLVFLRALDWALQELPDAHLLKRFDVARFTAGSGCSAKAPMASLGAQEDQVWKVKEKETGRIFALKKCFDAFQNSTDAQRTFREIIFLQAELNGHENIVRLMHVLKAESSQDLYVMFDFMESDLQRAIAANLLQPIHVEYVTYQILKALKYVHSGGVLHRDLKPANVLLNSNCHVRLCDFGLLLSGSPLVIAAFAWHGAVKPVLCFNGQLVYHGPAREGARKGRAAFSKILGADWEAKRAGLAQRAQLQKMPMPPSVQSLRPDIQGSYDGRPLRLCLLENLGNVRQMPSSGVLFLLKLPAQAKTLTLNLLKFNPERRPSAETALQDVFLEKFYLQEAEPLCDKMIRMPISDITKLKASNVCAHASSFKLGCAYRMHSHVLPCPVLQALWRDRFWS
ncbi:mapk15 [Symbiodinium sp. CCMP2592]|nr:mapk15 [Symbiodinium sp. CCMP2592]